MSPPDARVWDVELAALDVETTGLDPRRGDRVIEVAVVRGRLGEAPRVWTTLLDPGRPVGATHIHGITDAMVAGQPRFPAALPALARSLDGALPVAHNASFDIGFLKAESALARSEAPVGPTLDTLGLARRFFGLPSNTLEALCGHFAVPRARAHRAADDALATWELAWRMLRTVDPEQRWTVAEALASCRRRSPEELRELRTRLEAARVGAAPVEVEYHAADRPGSERTRRRITVRAVRSDRVVAWCHLREAERTFRLDRLRYPLAGDPDDR